MPHLPTLLVANPRILGNFGLKIFFGHKSYGEKIEEHYRTLGVFRILFFSHKESQVRKENQISFWLSRFEERNFLL